LVTTTQKKADKNSEKASTSMAGDGRNLTYPQFDYGSNTVQLEFDNNRRPELLSAIIVKRQSNDEKWQGCISFALRT